MIQSVALLSLPELHGVWESLNTACTIADQVMTKHNKDLLPNILIVFL